MITRTDEPWEDAIDGMIRKRTPDAISILSDLLEAGLKKGEITANDVRSREFVESRIIGGTMRACLPACGFVVDRSKQVQTTSEKAHKRWIPTWILEERWKAEQVQKRMQAIAFDLMGTPDRKGSTQGNLFSGVNEGNHL